MEDTASEPSASITVPPLRGPGPDAHEDLPGVALANDIGRAVAALTLLGLGALQRYRTEHPRDTRLLLMSSFLIDYPFANRLYPGALDALRHVGQYGPTVILSDGDVVFQPRKVARSGLWEEVGGRVLIYIHKELMLDQVMECYPARHYVMVDDKLRILTAMKKAWGGRLTTVFPRQGHYALDPKEILGNPPADVSIKRIGELAQLDVKALLADKP
ncbi:MAG: Sugar efflux transporter B [uncultured Paraburkholderia sp.]|nr:MAG: Sugar efflux transporter B [uncultured Paraburkholderia sp.]CAH2913015.1 MAG: Sugar efflux transporter B [uncultured Paraburkholderia sp.]CAH2913302.1 MAG: Sugar efflux transporter B [uncultured Paraburkholderia sp.]